MDRLTQYTPTGASLILDNPKTAEEAREQLMQKYLLAVNRLAAYEDTGLMPDEITKLRKQAEEATPTFQAEASAPPDCLRNLNPAGEYALTFAKNHGMSFGEAMEQPMVKARFEVFNKTGM